MRWWTRLSLSETVSSMYTNRNPARTWNTCPRYDYDLLTFCYAQRQIWKSPSCCCVGGRAWEVKSGGHRRLRMACGWEEKRGVFSWRSAPHINEVQTNQPLGILLAYTTTTAIFLCETRLHVCASVRRTQYCSISPETDVVKAYTIVIATFYSYGSQTVCRTIE